jgi:hypothetical protein
MRLLPDRTDRLLLVAPSEVCFIPHDSYGRIGCDLPCTAIVWQLLSIEEIDHDDYLMATVLATSVTP